MLIQSKYAELQAAFMSDDTEKLIAEAMAEKHRKALETNEWAIRDDLNDAFDALELREAAEKGAADLLAIAKRVKSA